MSEISSNGQSTAIVRPSDSDYGRVGAAIQRRSFGASELEMRRETQAVAAAETAKALISGQYIVAERRPRDVDDFRVRLLKHCDRPGFAQAAEYSKPVGGTRITGPSVRFVEAALAEYENVRSTSSPIYDDDEKRIVRVTVLDLERNLVREGDVTAEKFVERKRTKPGDEVLGERINSYGDTVYRIRATEDDFTNKMNAGISKMERNLGLKILPPDVVAEAMARCKATRERGDKVDPDAARRALADSFANIGIAPSDLKEYLGHDLSACNPAELDDLRRVFVAVRDGEGTWPAAMALKREERGEVEKAADPGADKLKATLAAAAERDRERAAAKAQAQKASADTKEQAPAKDKTEGAKAGEASAQGKAAGSKPSVAGGKKTAGGIEARRKAIAEAIAWSRNGDRWLGCVEDIEIAVEQVDVGKWGWWVTKAGEDVGEGDAGDLELARGQGIAEAAKL